MKIKVPGKGIQGSSDLAKTLKITNYLALEKETKSAYNSVPALYNIDQMSAPYMAKWRRSVSPKFSSRTFISLFQKSR